MKSYEMVEMLSEKAHVTLDKAKEALENSNWDMLDAAIYLEKKSVEQSGTQAQSYNVQPVQIPNYQQNAQTQNDFNAQKKESKKECSFSKAFGRFCGIVKNLFKDGMASSFIVTKSEKQIAEIPVAAFVILMICFFEILVPLMIVGLFFDFKYSFRGKGVEKITLNDVMQKASSVSEQMKSEFKAGMDSAKN